MLRPIWIFLDDVSQELIKSFISECLSLLSRLSIFYFQTLCGAFLNCSYMYEVKNIFSNFLIVGHVRIKNEFLDSSFTSLCIRRARNIQRISNPILKLVFSRIVKLLLNEFIFKKRCRAEDQCKRRVQLNSTYNLNGNPKKSSNGAWNCTVFQKSQNLYSKTGIILEQIVYIYNSKHYLTK